MNMKRVNYLLTEQQVKALEALRKETGRSVSEMIREAIEAWLRKRQKEK